MIVDQIIYTKRHNEGNYSHSEYSMTATLDENDDPLKCYLELKTIVDTAILGKPYQELSGAKEIVEAIKEEVAVAEEVKKEKKPRTVKPKPVIEEPVAEEVKEEEMEVVAPETTPPKVETKKVTFVPYDRGVEAHKSMLSAYLTKTYEDWKTKNPKQKIIDFNSTLHGKDFLDDAGLIIQSFKDNLDRFYA